MAEQQQRRLDYRVGIDTDEFRNQLVGMQADVSNTVNQINTAMRTSRGPRPGGSPDANQSLYQSGQGGYRYNPGTFEASMASTGILDSPHGVSQQQYQQKSSEIAAGNLAQGLTNASSVIGSAAASTAAFSYAHNTMGRFLGGVGKKAGRFFGGMAGGAAGAGAGMLGGLGTGALAGGATFAATGSPTLAAGAGMAGGAAGLAGTAMMKGGAKMGGLIGQGITKFAAPMAGAYAAQEMVMGGVERVNKHRAMNQTVDRLSHKFIPDNASESPGPGFGQDQRENVTDFLMNMEKRDPVFDGSDIQNMLATGTETGMFDSVGGPDEFKRKFKKMSEKVKEVTKVFRTSLDTAMGTVRELDKMGYGDMQGIESQMRKLRARSDTSGTNLNSMMKTFQQGSKMAQQAGLEGRAGADLATQVRANIENKVQHGEIDQQTVRQHGGAAGMSRKMSGRLLQFFNSKVGTTAAGAFADDDFESVDESKMFEYLSGDDDQTLVSKMSENMSENGFAESQRRLMQNRPDLISDITESDVAPHMATKIGADALEKQGLEPNKRNLRTYFRKNMGLNRDMAEEFVDMGTDTKQLRRRAATLEQQGTRRRMEKIRQRRWEAITPNADFAKDITRPYAMASEMVAQGTLNTYKGIKGSIQGGLESGRDFLNKDILGMPEQVNTELTDVSDEFTFKRSQKIWDESSEQFDAVNNREQDEGDGRPDALVPLANRALERGRLKQSNMFGGEKDLVRETFDTDGGNFVGDVLTGAGIGAGVTGAAAGVLAGGATLAGTGNPFAATAAGATAAGVAGAYGGAAGAAGGALYSGTKNPDAARGSMSQGMMYGGMGMMAASGMSASGYGLGTVVGGGLQKAAGAANYAGFSKTGTVMNTVGKGLGNAGGKLSSLGGKAFTAASTVAGAATAGYNMYSAYQQGGKTGAAISAAGAGAGVIGAAALAGGAPALPVAAGAAALGTAAASPFVSEGKRDAMMAYTGYASGQVTAGVQSAADAVDVGEFFTEEGLISGREETGHEKGMRVAKWYTAPDTERGKRIADYQRLSAEDPNRAAAQAVFPNIGNVRADAENQMTESVFSGDTTFKEGVKEIGRRRLSQIGESSDVSKSRQIGDLVQSMNETEKRTMARQQLKQESDLTREEITDKVDGMSTDEINKRTRDRIEKQAREQDFASENTKKDFFQKIGQQEVDKRMKTATALTQDVELSANKEIAQNKISDERAQEMAEQFNDTLEARASGIDDTGAPDIRSAIKSAARVGTDVDNPTESRMRMVAERIRPKVRDNPILEDMNYVKGQGFSQIMAAQNAQNIGEKLKNFDKRKEGFEKSLDEIFGEGDYSAGQIRGSLADSNVAKAAKEVVQESGTGFKGDSNKEIKRKISDKFDISGGEAREAVRMARKFASESKSVDAAVSNIDKISKQAQGIQQASAQYQLYETVQDVGQDLGLKTVDDKTEVLDRVMNASAANDEVKSEKNPLVGDLLSARDQIFGKMEEKGIKGITTESLGKIVGQDFSSKKEAMSFVEKSDSMGEDLKKYIGTALQSERDDDWTGREAMKSFMTMKSKGSTEGVKSAAAGGGEAGGKEMDKLSEEADALQNLANAVDNLAGQVK